MLRSWLVISACAASGCWESGTDAPALPPIPSPLADAGGRLRAPSPLTHDAAAPVKPQLLRYERVAISGVGQSIEFGQVSGTLKADRMLVVALATTDEEQPLRVALGKAPLTADARIESERLRGSVWSIGVAAGATQRLEIDWATSISRGLLVWMEWTGIDVALAGSVRLSNGDGVYASVQTNEVRGVDRGTMLLAVAIADASTGAAREDFTSIEIANNGLFGISLAYTVVDARPIYQTSFPTSPASFSWMTLVLPYSGVSSVPSSTP